MIPIVSNLPRINQYENKLVRYPSGVKKLYIRGTSNKIVPSQNLEIITSTFITNPGILFDPSKYDFQFREF